MLPTSYHQEATSKRLGHTMEPSLDSKQAEVARMDDLLLRHRRNCDEVSRWVISATEPYSSRSSRVKHDFCVHLGIAVHRFSLSRDGAYTKEAVDGWAEVWAINDNREPANQTGSADSLAAYLAIEFAQIDRIPAGSLCLAMLFGWADGSLNSIILDSCYMTPRVFAAAEETNELAAWATDIDSVWFRRGDEESNPPSPSPSPSAAYLSSPHVPPSAPSRSSPYGAFSDYGYCADEA